jgi:hypothetical protein
MTGPDCLEAQECRGDFWLMLEEALKKCGGRTDTIFKEGRCCLTEIKIPAYADMPLRDVVDVLAQNGIRMIYMADKHIDAVCVRQTP